LDARMWQNAEVCKLHAQIYLPLCRSRKSQWFAQRRCRGCQAEAEDALDDAAHREAKNEAAALGRRWNGPFPKGTRKALSWHVAARKPPQAPGNGTTKEVRRGKCIIKAKEITTSLQSGLCR